MLDNYKGGKAWAEETVPLYMEQLQPYYLLAQEKTAEGAELALLGYKKVGVLAAAGLDKLVEALPGASQQIDQFVQAAVVKTGMLGTSARDLASDIVK